MNYDVQCVFKAVSQLNVCPIYKLFDRYIYRKMQHVMKALKCHSNDFKKDWDFFNMSIHSYV